jgi:hypothetical protein
LHSIDSSAVDLCLYLDFQNSHMHSVDDAKEVDKRVTIVASTELIRNSFTMSAILSIDCIAILSKSLSVPICKGYIMHSNRVILRRINFSGLVNSHSGPHFLIGSHTWAFSVKAEM